MVAPRDEPPPKPGDKPKTPKPIVIDRYHFKQDMEGYLTLFLCGEKDFNVPVIGSEQMYQALRANGVDSQLIIYPGEFHGIRKPSYVQDRLERYLAWYRKYLTP